MTLCAVATWPRERASLEVVSPSTLVATGMPNKAVSGEFRIRNATDATVRPIVQRTNCGCNEYAFIPPSLGPGEAGVFRAIGRVPWPEGRVRQVYDLGLVPAGESMRIVFSIESVRVPWLEAACRFAWTRRADPESDARLAGIELSYWTPTLSSDPEADLVIVWEHNGEAPAYKALRCDRQRGGGVSAVIEVRVERPVADWVVEGKRALLRVALRKGPGTVVSVLGPSPRSASRSAEHEEPRGGE